MDGRWNNIIGLQFHLILVDWNLESKIAFKKRKKVQNPRLRPLQISILSNLQPES